MINIIERFFAFFGELADAIMTKLYPVASTDNELSIKIVKQAPTMPVADSVATSSNPHKTTPKSQNLAPKTMLQTFCDAITAMEGANPANNNPGNCRCSPVGYAPMYGDVKCNANNFAVFPTKELGRMYLENLVHFRALKHPDWTISDFFANYAPSTDGNNPTHYAAVVAHSCGVPVNITLAQLFA